MPSLPKICLVNMPFAAIETPSLGLEQIRSALNSRFSGKIRVEVLYLNMEFLEFMGGADRYRLVSSSHGRLTGAADWFFRSSAFPAEPDNSEEYFARFFSEEGNDEALELRALLESKRSRLDDFLDGLIEKHRLGEAMIVGCTCLFHQTMASLALARRLKAAAPSTLTILGGASCECEMGRELAKQCDQIDYVFSGPALVSFPSFLDALFSGEPAVERLSGVFQRGDCLAGSAQPAMRGEDSDIDSDKAPDYEDFLDSFAKIASDDAMPAILFETARGCSWGEKTPCSFCGLNGAARKHSHMSAANALKLFRRLFSYSPRCRFFQAVDNLVPASFFEEVFPFIKAPKEVAVMYEVRPILSERQLRTLCSAGVLAIQPGIEALSSRTLRLMRKGTTAVGNLRFLKACAKLPLRVDWNLLIGAPGERWEEADQYLELIPKLAHLPPPIGAFPISFDRFSLYFKQPGKCGLKLKPHEFYEFVYPFPPESLREIAYHFVDDATDHSELNAQLDRLNEAVSRWRLRESGADGLAPARLELKEADGETVLLDSRSGFERTIQLDPAACELLRLLDSPRRLSRLGERAAESRLAPLRELGILFEESGQVISLVITSAD